MGNSDTFAGDLAEAKANGTPDCCRYHRTAFEWLLAEVERLQSDRGLIEQGCERLRDVPGAPGLRVAMVRDGLLLAHPEMPAMLLRLVPGARGMEPVLEALKP